MNTTSVGVGAACAWTRDEIPAHNAAAMEKVHATRLGNEFRIGLECEIKGDQSSD